MAWTSNAKGRATVSISADQKTMQVSISDAAGRGVFSGQMWGPASSTPNQLINWSCTIHDQYDANTAGIATLKTSAVDIDGQQTHSLTDGYGRSIASIDQLGNVSTSKYDAGVTDRTSFPIPDSEFPISAPPLSCPSLRRRYGPVLLRRIAHSGHPGKLKGVRLLLKARKESC